jgi:hypothetical protein
MTTGRINQVTTFHKTSDSRNPMKVTFSLWSSSIPIEDLTVVVKNFQQSLLIVPLPPVKPPCSPISQILDTFHLVIDDKNNGLL